LTGHEKKKYLSYGGGVNSTAMMILLKNQGVEFEAVFADHGGDYPETYKYVKMFQGKGYDITILKCRVSDLDLIDYCRKYSILPSRWQRWCTDKFKITPMYDYFERPCVVYIGFDAEEPQRAKPSRDLDITNTFPLIEEGIDRKGCGKIIKVAGLSLPRKSGCYFCSFASKRDFVELRDNYPDLWCKVKKLEDDAIARRKERGKSPIYLRDKPLNAVVQEGQGDLWGLRKPCQCGI
jgi:hypothetical protein